MIYFRSEDCLSQDEIRCRQLESAGFHPVPPTAGGEFRSQKINHQRAYPPKPMSTTTLRYRTFTIDFLPKRRERLFSAGVRRMKNRISRRNLKRMTRKLIPQFNA